MDDRTFGPADGQMRFDDAGPSGASGDEGRFGGRREADAARISDADFDALARSFAGDDRQSAGVPLIIAGGVLVGLAVLALVYGWPLWSLLLCILGLLVVAGIGLLRRPPVAPLELTSSERDRVRRVLDEHGVRPAVALVRALYPGESSAAATMTVRILAGRR